MLNNQSYMLSQNRSRQMVKKNPEVAMFLISFIAWIFVSLVWISIIGQDLLLKHSSYGQAFLPLHVFIALISIVDVMLMFVNWRIFRSLEIKRQQAVAGDQRYIFAPQPQIAEKNLMQTFPIIIEHRCNWKNFAILVGTTSVLFAIFLGGWVIIIPSLFSNWISVGILLVSFIVFLVSMVVILIGIMYSRFKYKIILTAEGFFIERKSQLKWIAWRDARLFAIDAVPWTKKQVDPILYELSSANEILKWQLAKPVRRWFPIINLSKPAIAQEEYNIQVQNALAIIRQQTGLPLQDLRDHVQK